MRDALALVGDCRTLPLPDESVDAVVTDPPYGLNFMNRAWDHDVPGPDYWREVYRVMKPGAHLLAWAIPRKAHHLGQALEESGFMPRDKIMHLFGTGFPKSHRFHADFDGDEWDGWGTALKPSYEEIWICMKPTDGTFAENALKWGVAGLNIDGCRIGTDAGWSYPNGRGGEGWMGRDSLSENLDEPIEAESGRWPANTVLSHTRWCRKVGTKRVETGVAVRENLPDEGASQSIDVKAPRQRGENATYADEDGKETVEDWDCPPSCPVRMLDEQSGERPGQVGMTQGASGGYGGGLDGDKPSTGGYGTPDTGGASRFYYCAEHNEPPTRFRYCSKASRSEREAGLDGFAEKPGTSRGPNHWVCGKCGKQKVNVEGSYCTCDDPDWHAPPSNDTRANHHPTVKPISLARWLVRLVTRPGHIVLDPFCGSGSIGCAALLERRRYIGLDLNPEYVEIAKARLEHWTPKQVDMFLDQEAA